MKHFSTDILIDNNLPHFPGNPPIPKQNTARIPALDIENNFKTIYNNYHRRIYLVALRYLKSETNAQEVVQDVFMKLWVERGNIRMGTPIEAWLYTVAKNNTINKLKKKATEWKVMNHLKSAAVLPYQESNEDKLMDAEYQLLFVNAIKLMSENQRKVFQLVRNENLSYIQVAEHMGISPLTVKTHMSRALAHLKLLLPQTLLH